MNHAWKTIGWISFGSLSTLGLMHQFPDYMHLNQISNDDSLKNIKHIKHVNDVVHLPKQNDSIDQLRLTTAIDKCRQRLLQWKCEQCIPGYVIGISVHGKNLWIEGQGLADIENNIPCHKDTVMRIASISKSITATMLAKMVENEKFDLDRSIYDYLDEKHFPKKKWENEYVDITLRQLAAHLGGIRHYKKEENEQSKKSENNSTSEMDLKEYYIKDYFPTTIDSLKLFKDDPLVAKPGTKFNYSTFGYTLIAAVMETKMESKNFAKEFVKFIQDELGLVNTRLDENSVIIPNRSRYYSRKSKNGRICNVPYVDNSYKWAGGGLLSNIPDLLKYGNLMLYSFIGIDPYGRQGFLRKSTVEDMWKPLENSSPNWSKDPTKGYGLGFAVIHNGHDVNIRRAFAAEPLFNNAAMHSGAAIGASSILVIEPSKEIVVAIIANLQDASQITSIGLEMAKIFSDSIEQS